MQSTSLTERFFAEPRSRSSARGGGRGSATTSSWPRCRAPPVQDRSCSPRSAPFAALVAARGLLGAARDDLSRSSSRSSCAAVHRERRGPQEAARVRRPAPGQPRGRRVGAPRRAQPRRRALRRDRGRGRAVEERVPARHRRRAARRPARGRDRRQSCGGWTTRTSTRSALVASLQRQTGGNSAEVLDRVTETIRERGRASASHQHAHRAGTAVALDPDVPAGRRPARCDQRCSTRATSTPLFTEPLGASCSILAGIMIVIGLAHDPQNRRHQGLGEERHAHPACRARAPRRSPRRCCPRGRSRPRPARRDARVRSTPTASRRRPAGAAETTESSSIVGRHRRPDRRDLRRPARDPCARASCARS